jgi:putative ABC transport system substrate-binding protein
MKRRDFIALVGGATAWPLAARAQQPAVPVIGLVAAGAPDAYDTYRAAFWQALNELGYVEGRNVAIEYRWARGRFDLVPDLVADLLSRRVTLIVISGSLTGVRAAKAATTEVPIVFTSATDPVELGLVASLARPGGNLTGVNFLNNEVTEKRLDMLREMVPGVARVAVLVNPANAPTTATTLRHAEAAARALGLQIQVLRAATSGEISAAFTNLARDRPDALFVGGDPFFINRRVQLISLAARHMVPATYADRILAEAGGLMSYGADLRDAWHQLGLYAGRILKGAKPADLPVVQLTKLELVINAETARMLGLAVPPSLLAIADEVIE